jgi:hypothetical protein
LRAATVVRAGTAVATAMFVLVTVGRVASRDQRPDTGRLRVKMG